MISDELQYNLLKILKKEPNISQRALASKLGISLGKVNYCLQALIKKGLIKAQNFRNSNNKTGYIYLLTPRGIEEKAQVTFQFLRRKTREYEALQKEIEELQKEVRDLDELPITSTQE